LERRLSKFTEENRRALIKQDYNVVYSFLETIGYDLTKDIHQQFLDRHNPNLKVPMKYQKKKVGDVPVVFPDGTYNEEYQPRYRYQRDK
jgi:hypothetical protein